MEGKRCRWTESKLIGSVSTKDSGTKRVGCTKEMDYCGSNSSATTGVKRGKVDLKHDSNDLG